jgi:prenylcysteine oxidase/farnesylcysteine lyase
LNKSWVFHKEWHAFPELHPITGKNKFPHFILKASEDEQEGIIYTGAFENFISVNISHYSRFIFN